MAFQPGDDTEAARLNRLQIKPYYAVGTAALAGAATNADVPGATVTFTTEMANAVYLAFCVWDVDLTGATTATGTARLAVDGTPVSPLATYGQEVTTDRLTVAQNYSGTLGSAGSHTLKLVASPAASQTIQGTNSSILVIVVEVA